MKLPQLEKIVVAALEDVKGHEIEVINTAKLSPLFERIVIACGDSNRHVRSLAQNVQDKVREAGGTVISTEGEEAANGCWSILGDIVVHVMQPAIRAYYNLEELWRAKAPRARKTAAAAQAV